MATSDSGTHWCTVLRGRLWCPSAYGKQTVSVGMATRKSVRHCRTWLRRRRPHYRRRRSRPPPSRRRTLDFPRRPHTWHRSGSPARHTTSALTTADLKASNIHADAQKWAYSNAMVTCEMKLFQNYFGLRRRPSEIILFHRVETFPKLFQNYFTDLLNIFQHVRCLWNNSEIILELFQRLK